MADEDATRRKRDATASAKREESREAKVKAYVQWTLLK